MPTSCQKNESVSLATDSLLHFEKLISPLCISGPQWFLMPSDHTDIFLGIVDKL